MPDQARIDASVRGDGHGREPVDEVRGGIPLEVMWESYAGAQLCLVVRSAAFGSSSICEILASGKWVQMHGEKCIARTQGPEAGHLPVCEELQSMSFSVQPVAEVAGNEHWWIRSCQCARARVPCRHGHAAGTVLRDHKSATVHTAKARSRVPCRHGHA